jgi:hydrogenase maturation factor
MKIEKRANIQNFDSIEVGAVFSLLHCGFYMKVLDQETNKALIVDLQTGHVDAISSDAKVVLRDVTLVINDGGANA